MGGGSVADDGAVDVVLVGGGIMSATVGVLLQQLEPTWKIRMYERLTQVLTVRNLLSSDSG